MNLPFRPPVTPTFNVAERLDDAVLNWKDAPPLREPNYCIGEAISLRGMVHGNIEGGGHGGNPCRSFARPLNKAMLAHPMQ